MEKSLIPTTAVKNGPLDKCKEGNCIDKVLSFLSQNAKVSVNRKLCNIVAHVVINVMIINILVASNYSINRL